MSVAYSATKRASLWPPLTKRLRDRSDRRVGKSARSRSQGSGTSQCFLGMTELPHSWTHHRCGFSTQDPTSQCYNMEVAGSHKTHTLLRSCYGQFMASGVEGRVFFKSVIPSKTTICEIQWMAPHSWTQIGTPADCYFFQWQEVRDR